MLVIPGVSMVMAVASEAVVLAPASGTVGCVGRPEGGRAVVCCGVVTTIVAVVGHLATHGAFLSHSPVAALNEGRLRGHLRRMGRGRRSLVNLQRK